MSNIEDQLDEDSQVLLDLILADEGTADLPPDALVKFVLGSLDKEEENRLIRALVRSSALRDELVELQRRAEVEQVQQLAANSSFGKVVTDAIGHTLASLRNREQGSRPIPNSIWKVVGNSWHRVFATPQFALTRGTDQLIRVLGTEKRIRFTADIVEGDLQIEMTCGEVLPYDLAVLAFQDPAGALLPLWQGKLTSETIRINLGDMGKMLGFGEGRVPNSLFFLTVEEAFPTQKGFIDLYRAESFVQQLPLKEPISVKSGLLRLIADVSGVQNLEPCMVNLYLQVGSADFFLGASSLQGNEQLITVEAGIPQVDDCQIWGTSLLRLQIS